MPDQPISALALAIEEYEAAIEAWSTDHGHAAAVRLYRAEVRAADAIRSMRPAPATCIECGDPIAPFVYEGATEWSHRAEGGGMSIRAHEPRPAEALGVVAAPVEDAKDA